VRIQRATYFLGGTRPCLSLHSHSFTTAVYTPSHPENELVNRTNGNVDQRQRFLPFGGTHTTVGSDLAGRGYTGHLHNDEVGLIYMNARYYVPSLGRFASADTLVPDPTNPQLTQDTFYRNILALSRGVRPVAVC
jgi:RHS repeat-associated protein